MAVHRHFNVLTVCALALAMVGCGNSTGDQVTNSTSTTVVEPDDSPYFDETAAQTQQTAWNLPQHALSLTEENRDTVTVLGAGVAANARPGGMAYGMLANGVRQQTSSGVIACELQPSGAQPCVQYEETGVFGDTGTPFRSLARGIDGAIYSINNYYYSSPRLFLPASAAVGQSWRQDSDTSPIVGTVFAYKSLGTVSYRPTIRTVVDPDLDDGDPASGSHVVALDADGQATEDASQMAIDYSTAQGYTGTWLNVRRNRTFTVEAVGVTTPDSRYTGCIVVRQRSIYTLATPAPAGHTIMGLDQYSGDLLLYWKPGIGWVAWSGHETLPQMGFGALTSPNQDYGTFNLANYNSQSDQQVFGTSYNSYFGDGAYQWGWYNGYNAGYTDADPLPGGYYYYPEPRKDLESALSAFLTGNALDDARLLNNPMSIGRRQVAEAGYRAGYALAVSFYEADYQAIPANYDTLLAATSRSGKQLHFNRIPDAYRYDGALQIQGVPSRANVMSGLNPTGFDYANGYDGMGVRVDAFDPSATVGTDRVHVATYADGTEMRGIYVRLPCIGTTTTRTMIGSVTEGGILTAGDG
jgi:hypothetical protein